MKRTVLAAILATFAAASFAQYQMGGPSATPREIETPKARADAPASQSAAAAPKVNIPPPNCEPKPKYPGGAAMRQMEGMRKKYESDFEHYKTCMLAYIEERKAMHEANVTLHKAAIDDFNATMKAHNDAIQANR